MAIGVGDPKIQLCNDSGVEQDSLTLTTAICFDLVQMSSPKEYDTTPSRIKMDAGNFKEIIKGNLVTITIPVRLVSSFTSGAWYTFLIKMINWTQKIKVTPHDDEAAKTYWCSLMNGLELINSVRSLTRKGTLVFQGTEIISEVPE